jgi:signal transduction histidine kinase
MNDPWHREVRRAWKGTDPRDSRIADDISRLTLAASADGIVAMDDAGTIRLCNRAAEELLGRPARELIGTPFGFPVVTGQATEVDLMLPGGRERVAEMRVTTTMLEGERLVIAALRDVTRRKQAVRDLETVLAHQNAVVAIAAHELHGPLAAVSVLAHVLQDQQATMEREQSAQIIGRIVELTSRLQMLVRNFLTTARIDEGGVRTVPERVPVLEIIVEQLAEVAAKPGDIHVSCPPNLAVIADRAEVAVMLANYLGNALVYAAPPIEVQASERDGWAEIRVVDHGPGVPDSFAPHLFERFTRAPGTDSRVEGAGLGLWIVGTFAEANGGNAWYERDKGGGSCFCLRLPQAQEETGRSAR